MVPVSRKDIPLVGSVKLEEADTFIENALLQLEVNQDQVIKAVRKREINQKTLDKSKAKFIMKSVERYLKVLRLIMELREFIVKEGVWSMDVQKYARMEATVVQIEDFRKSIPYLSLEEYPARALQFLRGAINDIKKFRKDIQKRIEELKIERKEQLAAQAQRQRWVA